MNLWHQLRSLFDGHHASCAWCQARVELTGEPASTPLEALILQIVGGRKDALFHWLEDRLAEALYAEELSRGAWLTDIGVWGPAAFHTQAAEILRDLRPEFGSLKEEAA